MNISLEIIVNKLGEKHYLHLGDKNTVGRTAENRIQIPESFISTHHAVISLYDDGEYVVEDLGSKNGTFINGVKIESPTYIGIGDTLRFGLAGCTVVETPEHLLGGSSESESKYQPTLASTEPVTWDWDEDYKPGLQTSYPFVKKVKERSTEEQAAKPDKQYYPKRKTKVYDPFSSPY